MAKPRSSDWTGLATVLLTTWIILPIIGLMLDKLFAYLIFDATKELRELKFNIVPALKATLRDLEEKRMMGAVRGAWNQSDQQILEMMNRDLKSALCEAEDILDLVDYHRIEKKVTRDANSWCVQRLLPHAAGSYILANIICCCSSVLGGSYVQAFYNQNDVDSFVPIATRIWLKKQIKGIKSILTCSKRSDLLIQSSSSSITVKNCGKKGSSSKQTEIEDLLYRSIQKKVFGRDKDRDKIISMLREGPPDTYAGFFASKPYSVIGIYGISGSGKSTLAQCVCDYERGAGHFNPIMFIHVGKTFSVGDIIRDMLGQIMRSYQSSEKDLKSLTEDLEEALMDKRFLLVLDDLWVHGKTDEGQDILLESLCEGRSESKILVTARRRDAAADLGARELLIPDLDDQDFFSMFMHHALKSVTVDEASKYKLIGSRVVKQLHKHRSNIAAITVAQRLQVNNSIRFWQATASNDMLDSTMGALWWSYMQLDAVVRRCFAYLGTFPQGYVFKREIVVDLWIAQGFVETTEETEDMEALAQSYFDTLLAFAFLQDVYFGQYGCTMHDLLNELAVMVAGTESFRIHVNDYWQPEKIPSLVQHLFIEIYNIAEITKMENISQLRNLRTLIILEEENNKMKAKTEAGDADDDIVLEEIFRSMFKKLRKLRVLIIKRKRYSGLVQFTVPATISEMKHLRYLVLHQVCPIFPRTLTKLYHMQILDIPHHPNLQFFAEDMANLINLRLVRGFTRFPNIGRLTSLREIPGHHFDAYWRGKGYELKQLKHLNKIQGALQINFLGFPRSKDDALEAHLDRKDGLTKLSLSFRNDTSQSHSQALEGLCLPKGLEWLTIQGYKGSGYPSWILSRDIASTPKHIGLEFLECTTQLKSVPEDSSFLIHVRLLRLENCTWNRLPHNMKHLVSLVEMEIWRCDNMELLPTLPKSLLDITIIYCRVLSTTCEEMGHMNWYMIKHIPRKTIKAEGVLHLKRSSRSPSAEIQGREVIFKSHELDDRLSDHKDLYHILSNISEEPIELSYALLQNVTNDFSQEIGSGGFGVVYMGVFQHKEIAVKKLLQKDFLSDKQFEDELKCLRRVKHKNIVRFLGYCSHTEEKVVEYNGKFVTAEDRKRFLCFEYVPNNSLHDYLKDESRRHEWDIRYQLIDGVCRGLCYLHNKERITHLDLKPENILLDNDMVPKIADFGISRLFSAERTRIITKNILGSRMYIAPEYWSKGEISFKSDIFSLGVLLKKLLLGNDDFSSLENWHRSPDVDNPKLKRYIEVAEICMKDDPSERPTIDRVINMLSEKNEL